MSEQLNKREQILSQISMVTANYGEGVVLADVINDWFEFLGGKPGEVVVVDCGSDRQTQSTCWELFQQGSIDKLQLIHSTNDDFGKDKGYIKEYTAGAIASKPYVLVFKTDTLPYREGHDDWIVEAIEYLDRDDVFAIGGSFNGPSKYKDAWDGWYFSKKCSYNFSIMKRSAFIAAAHEFANDFILSGFQTENPAIGQERYFIEVAFEKYIERHNKSALIRLEDPTWSVFHTNVHDERLKWARERYQARKGIKKYLNAGYSDAPVEPAKFLYYGQPAPSLLKQIQIAFGASPMGTYWRAFKQRFNLSRSNA
jgi:hypothetical protein